MSVTSLSQILKSFSAPISEEHGWAIIYQSCVTLLQLEHETDDQNLFLLETTAQLLLSDDGSVHPSTFTLPGGRGRV